jgi:protein-S-isoprenylcysteine O-methyltransferase Ste14
LESSLSGISDLRCKLPMKSRPIIETAGNTEEKDLRLKPIEPEAASQLSTAYQKSTFPKFLSWIVRKRIAISLTAFLLLIGFNLLILRTRPVMPFNIHQLGSLLGSGLVLTGLAIRSWAAGTLHKNAEITSVGPYALVRNPLYVGSFLMIFGFCLLMKDWLALAFALGPLAVIYWVQVRAEENNLAVKFGHAWAGYAASVGRFFPRRWSARLWTGWRMDQWLRNREYPAVLTTAIGLFALWVFGS